jgi:hypothetical protein
LDSSGIRKIAFITLKNLQNLCIFDVLMQLAQKPDVIFPEELQVWPGDVSPAVKRPRL